MYPDKLDPTLPEWWEGWEKWEEAHGRQWAVMPVTFPDPDEHPELHRRAFPDPDEHPELHRLAFPEFGYRDAGRAFEGRTFEPGHPWNQLESHLHLTRKPGATGLDFEGDDPGIVTVTALGWDSAPAMRALRMVHVYATRDPERQTYQLAERVIREREDREPTEKERRTLAEAICEAARELAKRLGWDADGLLKLPWWDADSSVHALGGTRAEPAPRNPALDARLVAAGWHPPKPVSAEEHERYEQHMARWQHGRVVNAKKLNLAGSLGKVADLLAEFGKAGEERAKAFRKGADNPALWARPSGPSACSTGPTRSPVIWALTETLWLDDVAQKLKLEANARARQGRAALVAPVYSQIGRALWRAGMNGGSIVKVGGQLPLPLVAVSVLSELPVTVLGSETAQRFIRWVIRAAAAADSAQCYVPIPDAAGVTVTRLEGGGVEVAIVGGIRRLAEVMGAKSGKAEEDVQDTLTVLSGVHLQEMFGSLRGGSGGVLIHCPSEGRGRGGGVRKLTFIVHPILCPGAVKAYQRSLHGENRILTPVLPPPVIPKGFERGKTPAALGRLDWEASQFLSRHRVAAKKQGGIAIPWDSLAKTAGVTPKALEAALAVWTAPGPLQRWQKLPGGLWMYASSGEPEAAAARAFILEGAGLVEARALKGAKGGSGRAANRSRRRRGGSPP